jgi:prophage regulatory protein
MSEPLLSTSIEKFLPRPEVLHMVGIKSPTTLYDLIRRGEFPKPYSVTVGRKCWALSEIQAWIAERKRKQMA